MRTPAEFDADCVAIVAALRQLREDYAWAYGYGLSPTRGESSGSVPIGQVDTTGSVAVEDVHKARVRAVIDRASTIVQHGAVDLHGLRRRLGKLMGTDAMKIPARGAFPRTVGKADFEKSKAAQKRRQIRSEHYG